MRKRISFYLKWLITAVALVGVVLSFFNAAADGYLHWSKRLLYFTSESNIWIALSCLSILLLPYFKGVSSSTRVKNSLYVLKYVFTVSITLTGFIFCAVLAPGAKNDNYNAWTVASVMTHVIVPVLSVLDFFLDEYRVHLKRKHMLYTAIPPFLYLIFASILGFKKVDFGRGDTFPYFFMNYKSPAGIFGTSDVMPYKIGSFYWIVFILFIVIGISALYRAIYNKKQKGFSHLVKQKSSKSK